MANKTCNEKCGTQLKRGKVQDLQNKLAHKLQLDLERDLLRSFQDSIYCDIKLTVDSSSSVSTHSCILRTRACRFYKFIYAEFEFFVQNGISVFNVYNASFTHLQSFVENIYTSVHTAKAEDCIIKHLQEIKTSKLSPGTRPAKTPESDLFFTPKCSPSELQKPFASSKLKLQENNVASYYKIVSVDDIPVDEKVEGRKSNEEEGSLLEKELAEQDELFSSFKTIFSKKTKIKPNSLSLGNSSQPPKKPKPKFNRKFESNVLLYDDHKGKYRLPQWKPNPAVESRTPRDKYSGLKLCKKNPKAQEKGESETNLEDPAASLCSSDMEVSTTGGDSGLDNSSICQQETSPKEHTMSETSGVDLTEAAINEDIPNDGTFSTKPSTGSSVSSEDGTWGANDELKGKSPSGRDNLNEEEILRLDEMERNIRDCEIFLYMERQGSVGGDSHHEGDHAATPNPKEMSGTEGIHHYAEDELNNPQGEPGRRLNNDEEENYYNYNLRNSSDAIASRENLNDVNLTSEEDLNANEFPKQGASGELILNTNVEYFSQAKLQQTKTPPCTPKKTKTEEPEAESYPEPKSNTWECNNSTGVSNYFIDASSLLDEDEIISPPISLINFKSLHNCEEPETKTDAEEEEPQTAKKVVSNFFTPDSNDDSVSYMKEQERRQGEIIFRNSIPHFSKHDVEGNQMLENTERLRGGADPYTADVVEDDSEQVVPSADLNGFGSNRDAVERNPPGSVESHFFESVTPSDYAWESEEVDDQTDGIIDANVEAQPIPSSRESTKDLSSSSVCSGSPNLRRRNEAAPILSGGVELMEEEKKVQRKGSQTQGEAWIVTFDDNKKARNRFASSDTGSEAESGRENSEDRRTPSLNRSYRQSRKTEPSVEFYVREQNNARAAQGDSKPEPKMNPVEKSSSFGYFLELGKESAEEEAAEEKLEQAPEKRNIFSMFIGMDDDSKPRKPKPVLEKEQTFDKSSEENHNEPAESSEDVKKSFYMFIGSDSPNVKRKPAPKKPETAARKTYLRTQSYTVEGHPNDQPKAGSKTDVECSSSDNSLPYAAEAEGKGGRPLRGRLPLGKFRGEPKITAWCETKVPNESNVSSESWLRTKDIQVNYKGGRGEEYKNGVYLKKDSTFIMGNEYKGKHEKYTRISLKDLEETKPPKRDSGVISDDSFVKLSDLDISEISRPKDRMSQSTTESSSRKSMTAEETPLSKSIGCEGGKVGSAGSGLYDRKVNQSLSRLFPNLSAQSLASISRKDGETSETSEVSSSLQSSVEPTGLEISTSETDVSTHVGTTSKLGEDLLKMFLEEISPDVVVEVTGRRIKAHKCILSSRCQYFAAMLSGGWVESAGNVISLQGFSYNAVHFALRHIYSGESRIPESLNIVELATLADMLCLDGLQEIISYNLKVKYCHSFHVPCSVCSVGVIDCLPIAAAYGLEDLYRKCLRWITKYFVKLWPTKSFGSLSKELLEKCYLHQVVHLTVDNVLDTIVNIDKVRGSLPNVRWAEPVSHLVNKLHNASVKYVAEHFSSVLTSDNFLALGKEAGWNVSRLEDSLIETIRYLPPEQACWSHARLHRILSVASGPDPPPEMDWNENFLKLLQLIAELVENSLIKQAPRAAKSKAWRQMEPELRSRIQEAACLVLSDQEPSPAYRRSNYVKRETHQPNIPQTAKSRTLELRQIKLAMSQQANRPNTSRPLSLQIDQRPKKDSRFVPLRQSVSTSSVRKPEPTEGIRKTQSRSQILGSTYSEPKKTINPRYSEVKSRYLEPRSPQKIATDKATSDANQRRAFRYISSSDSSRNCSPALRPSNSRSSIPQAKKSTVGTTRQPSVFKSESTSTLEAKRDRSFASTKSDTTSAKTLSRLTGDENMSTDSLCTDSLLSDKEATLKRRPGKENLAEGRRRPGNPATAAKSSTNSPIARRHDAAKTPATKKLIMSKPPSSEGKTNPAKRFPATAAKIPVGGGQHKVNSTSGRTIGGRNQRHSGKTDQNLVNGNSNRRRSEVDSENNKKNSKEPTAVSRSGTFLKDEPTILKKPRPESEVQG